jgi:hypothetical protein
MRKTDIPTSAEQQSFEVQAREVLRRVRNAFAEVIEALPAHISRAHELQKALDIDKKLGWRVFKLVQGTDPFTAAQHVPGAAGVRIFLKAAADRGVPTRLTDSAARAAKEFDRLIEVHAGDRASLEMMMSGFAKRGRRQGDLAQRRSAFRANSYLWGVQAKTHLKADFLHPSGTSTEFDIASVRGFVGFRRIRADVPWVIARARCTDDDGRLRPSFVREPLEPAEDPDAPAANVPLLREFCTKPLPEIRRVDGPHGFVEDELVEGPVGNTAAINCIIGEVARRVASYYRDEHNRFGRLTARMRTPCEVLLFDQFVYEGMFGPIAPEMLVYSDLHNGPDIPLDQRARDRLPLWESVDYLGKGPAVIHTPDVPRYADMARYVFERLGWDGERFDVYRIRIQYPIIPSTVAMRHELPEPPT